MQWKVLLDRWMSELRSVYDQSESRAVLRVLLKEKAGLDFHTLLSGVYKTEPDPGSVTLLEDCMKRLLNGEPLQHITGFAWFDDLRIKVTPSVLIPREETAEMVQLVSERLKPERILDVCTGSGCIALALKRRFPDAFVSALDVSEEALSVAVENGKLNGLEIDWTRTDINSESLPEQLPGQYDLVISNPPYVLFSEKEQIHRNVLDYEPHLALFVSDDDPLKFYRVIMKQSHRLLKKGGCLCFELNPHTASECWELSISMGFKASEIVMDLSGKERFLLAYL